jgi:hypothetical protein
MRASRTGMGEEQVLTTDFSTLPLARILPFPDGRHLLILTTDPISERELFHAYKADLSTRATEDLGEVSGRVGDVVWDEAGKSILFGRTVNELTNIWKFTLADKALTQVTFGPGPDVRPMPDPSGKGLYFINGKSSGYLTAYNTRTKESRDVAADNATQPAISRDGKRLMYITIPSADRNELWIANIDGSGRVKIASSGSLATAGWSADNSRILFMDESGTLARVYVVGADGSGLRTLTWTGTSVQNVLWSADQKSVYLNALDSNSHHAVIWRESVEGSTPEKVVQECGFAFDVSPDGQFLGTLFTSGSKTGVYEYSLAEHTCTPLLPGVTTFGMLFDRDGKSLLYAVPGPSDVTIYRQNWQAGKVVGQPQVALKLPFAFPLLAGGNAYDFTRDLSVVVYARSGGHADLYFMSQN